MPATISKVDANVLIDALVNDNLVDIECPFFPSRPMIGEVVAWFANTRDAMPVTDHPNWRCFIVGSAFRDAVIVVNHAKQHITTPGFRFWNAAIDNKRGCVRAVVADPLSVQGIIGYNLFFVVLNNHDKDIWDAIWASVVSDTKVLSVNSELFGQWRDFTHFT